MIDDAIESTQFSARRHLDRASHPRPDLYLCRLLQNVLAEHAFLALVFVEIFAGNPDDLVLLRGSRQTAPVGSARKGNPIAALLRERGLDSAKLNARTTIKTRSPTPWRQRASHNVTHAHCVWATRNLNSAI